MPKPLSILIAPDSFKGSLTAREVCQVLAEGLMQTAPDTRVIQMPLADGGEGTVEALVLNTGGRSVDCDVTGPRGDPVRACYGILGDEKTAVIEMAAASGLPLLPPEQRNPAYTTSYGTGELIRDALKRGYRRILLGLGGSATNDYGAGALQALGFSFLDSRGREIGLGGLALQQVTGIVVDRQLPELNNLEFVLLADVDNPLLGDHGATWTYARQKGATPADLPRLEAALEHFNTQVEKHTGRKVQDLPGAGAAGGMGAGLLALLSARQVPGAEFIVEQCGFTQALETGKIDLVITGEGRLDAQTARGKLPFEVARQARAFAVPVVAVAGSKGPGFEAVLKHGIAAVYSLTDIAGNQVQALKYPKKYLRLIATKILQAATASNTSA